MLTTMTSKKSQASSAQVFATRLRVAVADDEPEVLATVVKMLESLGHEVTCTAATGRELVNHCLAGNIDLVMTDIRMPDMDGLEAAAVIYEKVRTPIIILSGHCDKELIERAEENHVFAYLMKPITSMQLEPAIALATRRFEELEAMEHEANDLRQALADRKTIERAKGLIMKHLNLDEQEAFRKLQKLASSKNKKLIEIAEMVLTTAEALSG